MPATDFSFTAIDGSALPLSRFAGKPILLVNVASQCGFTPQYGGLQKLHEAYGPRGLVVLGVAVLGWTRLPAAWGYSHPFTVLPVTEWPHSYDRPEVQDVEVDAVGELCTPRDVLTRGQHVERLRVGDLLVFARTGAYGWDISHHDFLRHDPPAFVITG